MLPLAAMAPLALIPGVADIFDAPRKALFSALGADESGSGSSLLQSLLGVDPNSSLGKYGGLAAEMIGDPLNLLSAGAMAGVNAAGKAAKASKVAGLENELATANRMQQAVRDAEATVPFGSTTFGDLPRGSTATRDLVPEMIVPPRRDVKVGELGSPYPDPTISNMHPARKMQDRTQDSIRKVKKGDEDYGFDENGNWRKTRPYTKDDVFQAMQREADAGMAQNNSLRDMSWKSMDRRPVSPWETLSDPEKVSLSEALLGSPRLQALMPQMNSYAGPDFNSALSAISDDLWRARNPQRNGLLDALLTAAAGGTVGGIAGTRFLEE